MDGDDSRGFVVDAEGDPDAELEDDSIISSLSAPSHELATSEREARRGSSLRFQGMFKVLPTEPADVQRQVQGDVAAMISSRPEEPKQEGETREELILEGLPVNCDAEQPCITFDHNDHATAGIVDGIQMDHSGIMGQLPNTDIEAHLRDLAVFYMLHIVTRSSTLGCQVPILPENISRDRFAAGDNSGVAVMDNVAQMHDLAVSYMLQIVNILYTLDIQTPLSPAHMDRDSFEARYTQGVADSGEGCCPQPVYDVVAEEGEESNDEEEEGPIWANIDRVPADLVISIESDHPDTDSDSDVDIHVFIGPYAEGDDGHDYNADLSEKESDYEH